ncbi:MAG: adenosine kinase [SAR324 cluster bacterium]|nr:adenosine kinase [SAR324 cluster bacterium]
MNKIDVFGLGNPLIDLQTHVSESFLQSQGLEKNRMYLVDLEAQEQIVTRLKEQDTAIVSSPGGSCANTMIGISQLGGTAAYSGRIGKDEFGSIYKKKLTDTNVTPSLGEGNGATGSSLILVLDDGSRTMNTHLGMCQEFHPDDISEKILQNSQFVYIEGYLWDTETQKKSVMTAVQKAKQHQVKISLTLSDPFCVQRNLDDFQKLLKDSVDLVFCNQEEAFDMAGTTVTHDALSILANDVETVALTMGDKGALISHQGEVVYIDPLPVNVVDTTGAGDAFAAGFLYGITHGKSPLESGRIAGFMAAQVISQLGAHVQGDLQSKLQAYLTSS